jgi:H+/gluconate symporter-like permease
LISEATSISVLAGITGSASGGLGIALESLGATYYQRAIDLGVNPEVMHRVASMASGGLDSLPHNGAVITLLTICGLTHKQSYFDIGVVTVIIPIIGLALVIGLASF